MTVQRVGRTQGERSAAMQRRLLDATIVTLFEKGYSGTTTSEVQARAGVSRGALLHHYSSRDQLMVAAIDHLTRERVSEVITLTQSPPPAKGRMKWAISVLWSTFEGPLFTASLELWLAARNDVELRTTLIPQERILGQAIRSMASGLFDTEVREHDDFNDALDVLLDAMRGAAARAVLRTTNIDERLIDLWTEMMNHRLEL